MDHIEALRLGLSDGKTTSVRRDQVTIVYVLSKIGNDIISKKQWYFS